MHDNTEAPEAHRPHWLMELRLIEVCALVGALGFIAYCCFCR